jgi:hypothetical protein
VRHRTFHSRLALVIALVSGVLIGPSTSWAGKETLSTEDELRAHWWHTSIGANEAVGQEELTAKESASQSSRPNESLPPLLFSDDFEAYGDLSRWGSLDNQLQIVQDEVVYSGRYAARATSSGEVPAYSRKQFRTPRSELFYRVRFNIIDQGANPVTLLRFLAAAGGPVLSLSISPTGLLGYENHAADKVAESAQVVSHGEWHEVQVRVKANGTPGIIEVWLDGNRIEALSESAWLGDAPINRIEIGDSTAGRKYDVAFDDIALDTSFISPSREADPVPGKLTVRTTPAQPGLAFELEGRTFLTDEQGVARIDVKRWSWNLRQRVKGIGAPTTDGGHATFGGWYNWTGTHDRDLSATFNLSYPVSWHFVDLQGNVVDPNLVTSFTIKSSTGVVQSFSASQHWQPQLLLASSVTPRSREIQKPVSYAVESAIVGGSNVVNRSQQRFSPSDERDLEVRLLFYSVGFRGRDAFFGFPIGSEVKVQYPDGEVQHVPLQEDGTTVMVPLPRGKYLVSVTGAGFSPPQPIALSRDQTVDLEVISYLDMAVALTFLGSCAVGLLVFGRPQLLHPLRRLPALPLNLRRAGRAGV